MTAVNLSLLNIGFLGQGIKRPWYAFYSELGAKTSLGAACVNGDTVATWEDQGAHGRHLIASSGTTVFSTAIALNGYPGIVFSGSQLTTAAFPTCSAFTRFTVARRTFVFSDTILKGNGSSNSPVLGHQAPAAGGRMYGLNGISLNGPVTPTPTLMLCTELYRSTTGGSSGNISKFRVNGVESVGNTGTSNNTILIAGPTCEIYATIGYRAVFTPSQIAAVEAALTAKYAL